MGEIAAATKQKDAKELELSNLLDKMAKAKEDQEATANPWLPTKSSWQRRPRVARPRTSCMQSARQCATRRSRHWVRLWTSSPVIKHALSSTRLSASSRWEQAEPPCRCRRWLRTRR